MESSLSQTLSSLPAHNSPTYIILTGGPSGGKTTALHYLKNHFENAGTRVFIVPEAATQIIGGGIKDISEISKLSRTKYLEIQKELLRLQIANRERFTALASLFPNEHVLVLSDRGELDDSAYMTKKEFSNLLRDEGLGKETIMSNYDGVIHLVSAASGAADFYTVSNNAARRESLQEARRLEAKALSAWIGHPHLRVVGNQQHFEQKLELVKSLVSQIHLSNKEIERKFLLSSLPSQNDLPATAIPIEIIQHYILYKNSSYRLRSRTQSCFTSYYLTQKFGSGLNRTEFEKVIDKENYSSLLAFSDKNRLPVKKIRWYFVDRTQYFELDIYQDSHKGLAVLEIELLTPDTPVLLPRFLNIREEVTNNPSYKNSELARISSH